jgi:hypothetical protein
MGIDEEALTALTLAPPGIGDGTAAVTAERRVESMPSEFWDAMRGVIAREVRDYVTSTFAENTSGFH